MQQNLLYCVNYRAPFQTKSLTKLNIFQSFRNKLVKGGKGWKILSHAVHDKQRLRKPRTRTSACIKNLLTSKKLTMVMVMVMVMFFSSFFLLRHFQEENSSTDFAQYFFSCVMAAFTSLHQDWFDYTGPWVRGGEG